MKWEAAGERILSSLESDGFVDGEVYVKSGRSRRFALVQDVRESWQREEIGWAVRAGSARGLFFFARTGEPVAPVSWPHPGPGRVALPAGQGGDRSGDAGVASGSTVTEGEASALLGALAAALDSELSGAVLGSALLEDGGSEAEIISSRGVRCGVQRRAASLRVEAVIRRGTGASSVVLELAEPTARDFSPSEIARRLAERLVLAGGGILGRAATGRCVLAPEVGAHLLAGCVDRLVGPTAAARGRAHRWGREGLTLIDDGREGGWASAPWDGEGVATRRVVLVEQGRYLQPLLAWWQTPEEPELASGCVQRASWKDLPMMAPSQLWIEPTAEGRAADLVSSIGVGFYWREALGRGVFDAAADRFALPVTGYSIAPGRDPVPVRRAIATGSISELLEGIDGVGDDLCFSSLGSRFGAPTLRVARLAVEPPR